MTHSGSSSGTQKPTRTSKLTPADLPVGQQDIAPDHRFPACTADGTWVAYERTVSNGGSVFQTNVWRKNLGTSDPPEDMTGCQSELIGIGYYEVGSPVFSPGGRYFLFRSDRGGTSYDYDIGKLPIPQSGPVCHEPDDVQWLTGPAGYSDTEPDWGEL
jgi:Tol biopolymer transport system component